jgi:2-polyprenyl-3-methyl-5-hydroxy-6-metoxy-1,4-benzoquinol methylase
VMEDNITDIAGYTYLDGNLNPSHSYLLPAVREVLAGIDFQGERRLFELGCGNGSVAASLTEAGYTVTGVDPSNQAVQYAASCYPHIRISQGSAYDDLAHRYGQFPVVLSLEVVEHVYFPRKFAAVLYNLLLPGGTAVISTPYHGYLKNLILSISGKMDDHFTALWDHGHIKFWSVNSLRTLLNEAGFQEVSFVRVGRVPALAKSMIAIAKKER